MQQPITATVTQEQEEKNPNKLENKNRKKNNCVDTLSDKLARLHRKKLGHDKEKPQERNWIFSYTNTK